MRTVIRKNCFIFLTAVLLYYLSLIIVVESAFQFRITNKYVAPSISQNKMLLNQHLQSCCDSRQYLNPLHRVAADPRPIDTCLDSNGMTRKCTSLNLKKKLENSSGEVATKEERNNNERKDLDKFRYLMGTFYGIAGVAHGFDCLIGPSQLLSQVGLSPFYELSLEGEMMAIIWCLAGPLAFALSRKGGLTADLGLAAYGFIEVGVASFSPLETTLINALAVQLIVFISWLYSRGRE